MIYAIVLAAGESRRLGQPKQLLPWGSSTLINHVMNEVYAAGFAGISVVTGAWGQEVAKAIKASAAALKDSEEALKASAEGWGEHEIPWQVAYNPDYATGMASSIHCGMATVPVDAAGVAFVLNDQPALSAPHLQKMIEAFRAGYAQHGNRVVVASTYLGADGVPAIFGAGWFPLLAQLQGDQGARKLFPLAQDVLLRVEFAGGEWDIDSPADLARPEILGLMPQTSKKSLSIL